MAEMFFEYGVMGSGKTVNLLKEAYNYEKIGKKVTTFAPEKDDRNGVGIIKTATGWSREAIAIGDDFDVRKAIDSMSIKPDVIFVDEAQFLTEEQIYDFAYIANVMNIPVNCYGLITDFCHNFFRGAPALLKCATKISRITLLCRCGATAVVNMRIANGRVVTEGEQVYIGNVGESYEPVCLACYHDYLTGNKKLPQSFSKTG
ncbi:MAG: thymidine kinase [Clostridia bacterium]|nr:thymidine kinase [Clostridia bacterium]